MAARILLCDDERRDVDNWVQDINAAVGGKGEVDVINPTNFSAALETLEQRRRAATGGDAWSGDLTYHAFDDVDVLLVDYDLTYLQEGRFITGEAVAYLARCFSRCGVIVALNQFREGFDLTLAGHPESYADVNIRADQLGNPGLWGPRRSGFRPWAWPELLTEVGAMRRRREEVFGNLRRPIVDYLELRGVEAAMPRAVLEYLEVADGTSPTQTTFADFVERSDHGARIKGSLPDDVVAAVAAARVTAWLNDILLSAQEILIDAPHLVMRVPSLADGLSDDRGEEMTRLYTTAPGALFGALEAARYGHTEWTRRACWYWGQASDLAASLPLVTPRRGDRVFCEDLSRFLPRAAARPFVAEVPSAYRRRFVFDPRSPEGTRLAETEGWRHLPQSVDYRPQIRLAM